VVCNSAATRDAVAALGVARDSTVVARPPATGSIPLSTTPKSRRGHGIVRWVRFSSETSSRERGSTRSSRRWLWRDADIELTVVGRAVDEHVAEVRRLVRERGLDERVRFTGRLSDAELAEALREATSSRSPPGTGFGIVYLEGMSFGLPAIASRAGGAIETVADGETGVLVDPDDPVAVARALDEFATDPDRLAAMGRAARRRYERHPSWAESTARVRRLLADVADAPDPVEPEVAT